MKKIFLFLTIFLVSFSHVKSEEYPNSWKIDLNCKQGGSRGTTVGGDNGGETADIASKYFIDNLK
tara:strand:+ start:12 stop:206 length:195 start_codon:yes stop_codon:yes gene_type:complete